MHQTQPTTDVRERARATAQKRHAFALMLVQHRGFDIVPVECGGKRPLHAWKAERRMAADVRGYARLHPLVNWAVITGSRSGVIVIDADGSAEVAFVTQQCAPTPMMTSTSKGAHFYYRCAATRLRNRVGVRVRDVRLSIDTKGENGLATLPYSVHHSGFVYERIGEWPTIDQLPMFDPRWLPSRPLPQRRRIVLPADTSRRIARARAYIATIPGAIEGAGGDHLTMRATMMSSWRTASRSAVSHRPCGRYRDGRVPQAR